MRGVNTHDVFRSKELRQSAGRCKKYVVFALAFGEAYSGFALGNRLAGHAE